MVSTHFFYGKKNCTFAIFHSILPSIFTKQVWGNISWKGVGRLVLVDGTLNADGYIELLEENLLPSIREMGLGDRWIFQQDGKLHFSIGICI